MRHQKMLLSKTPPNFESIRTSAVLIVAMVTLIVAVATTLATAQTYTDLHDFKNKGGIGPQGGLAQGTDGYLYGVTKAGGAYNYGTVFKITPAGKLRTLYSFPTPNSCSNPFCPYGVLVQAADGTFYGTTHQDGDYGLGTVFRITAGGTFTTLHSFGGPDGSRPNGGLVQAFDGDLYGTTNTGGANGGDVGLGTVFKITTSGVLTSLHSFNEVWDGFAPYAGLVQATDGNLYGTTALAGPNGGGTAFKITPNGALTTLVAFGSYPPVGPDQPISGLIQATDGNFYGTSAQGGFDSGGLIYKITPSGALTVLYTFCSPSGCPNGSNPYAPMVQATDGNFYGVTYSTIFKITPGGTLTTLYTFDGSRRRFAGLVQATNGKLYGTATGDGAYGEGTVFSFDVGLSPFVGLVSTSGKVGTTIRILGQGFTGTTSVSFNGIPAGFNVWTDTFLTAKIPNWATSGPVTVTTPTGTLTSNHDFQVHPVIVNVVPASGTAGTPVVLTGTSFTQTTKVVIGGVKATAFTVDSDTQVTATVPTGAATGYIVVTTTGGRSRSPDTFTVTP